MKIECESCGHENELGRVFCASCGAKLNLSQTSVAEIRSMSDSERGPWVGKLVGGVVLLLAVAAVGLACWPQPPLGAAAKPGGDSIVREKLRGLQQVVAIGKAGGTRFTEGELNAYLAVQAKESGFATMGVALAPGTFHFRMVEATPVKVKSFTLMLSYDVTGSPVKNDLAVTRGAVGHLPLPGPAAALAARRVGDAFGSSRKERQLLEKVSKIDISQCALDVTVGP